MSISYILGNFIGRFLMSFIIVWIICLLCSRFNWRLAFARSRKWYSIVAALVLTIGGLGAALVAAGGIR
jgi:hypothetical protein